VRASGPIYVPTSEDDRDRRPKLRSVWRSVGLESSLLLIAAAGVLAAERLLDVTIPAANRPFFEIGFAVLPLVLWLIFSLFGETRVKMPREGLLTVMILSALGANAVGIPLAERFFVNEEWLSTASGATRILGYLLTVSITQEFIKFAALRYSVWPRVIRTRMDGPAYALAAGIGYALALNINYILNEAALPSAVVLRVAEFTLAQMAISIIMGFFLSEAKLSQLPALALPAGLLLAALVNALTITLRAGLIVGTVSPTSTASAPLQGLGVSVVLIIVMVAVFNFLINNADERETLRLKEEQR
jgi:hypothetical protein